MDNYQGFIQLEAFNQGKRKVLGQQILGVEKKTVKQTEYYGTPYGLQYGLSSATVSRASKDDSDGLWDVIPIVDDNFQNRADEKLKEREEIVAKLKSIGDNIDERSIMNLPPPSLLISKSRKRKSYITQAPSLLQLSKQSKNDISRYDHFIKTGPRYVDQSLESPLSCVTARRSDLMYRKPIKSDGLETGTSTRRISNNLFDQSWKTPISRFTAPYSDSLYPRPIKSDGLETGTSTRRISNNLFDQSRETPLSRFNTPHSDSLYPRPIRSVCFEATDLTPSKSNNPLAFPFSFSTPNESKEQGEE